MMALFKPPYCSDSTGIFFLSCLGNTISYQAAWASDSYNLSYKKISRDFPRALGVGVVLQAHQLGVGTPPSLFLCIL